MKKNYLLFSFMALFMAVLTAINSGCSSDENIALDSKVENTPSELKADVDRVLGVLAEFDNDVNKTTRTRSASFNVKGFDKKTLNFDMSGIKTRVAADVPANTSVDVYTVTFEKNNKEGYSILTADDRLSKVYAYTEYGSFSDTITNKVLASIIKWIPTACKEDLENYYTSNRSGGITWWPFTVGPSIITHMDNIWPFNQYFGSYSGTSDRPEFKNHYSSNCVAVGMTLILSKFGPEGVLRNYDTSVEGLSRKFKWLAYESDPKGRKFYGYAGSTTYPPNTAKDYLDKAGFKYVYKDSSKGKLDDTELFNSMVVNEMPVLAYYVTSPLCWVMSGMKGDRDMKTGNLEVISQIYCNWCQNGKSDGWYTNWYRPSYGTFDRKAHRVLYFKDKSGTIHNPVP